jgi:hypothetical protein
MIIVAYAFIHIICIASIANYGHQNGMIAKMIEQHKNKLLRGNDMKNVVTNIFDEIDKLLNKHSVMVYSQDGSAKLLFLRTLEVDLIELKNKYLSECPTE